MMNKRAYTIKSNCILLHESTRVCDVHYLYIPLNASILRIYTIFCTASIKFCMFVLAVNLEAGVQRSGTMMWADDIYNYQGITPTFAQNFNETVPWEGRTDTLISRFVHPIYTTNFRTLYNEEPDHRGHVM
ncbi:uncharacterized protein LOC126877788 [Bombus huntii]|uniref:uncharacterized protein LOC126867356 n=1 Tax=Bombus huntii TaxID=85661 RepID=UPI0021A980CF|nr:uncharacterized protein LOC126867355 isoform X1 [Bombus huntii]XP_050477750.1 uncharacterized protein LOC126867355 isoform X2 [Bombus huntii]XP_050477751.1 uncharacterized protein LOC126867355 isoform X3 [Bombus huntii]XP_050477753.1 uncharacterized protein LOC126867356 [Bombus huntii]XP_050496270.1 uncharacterized protein LOC126877788 [Bombus huntii]